jgi:hypothetical protein
LRKPTEKITNLKLKEMKNETRRPTFEEFQETREELTVEQFRNKYGADEEFKNVKTVHSYNGWYLLESNEGEFYTHLMRETIEADTLEKLERIFWDEFAKYEY